MEKSTETQVKRMCKYTYIDKNKSDDLKKYLKGENWQDEVKDRAKRMKLSVPQSRTAYSNIINGRSKNLTVLKLMIEIAKENKELLDGIDELKNTQTAA